MLAHYFTTLLSQAPAQQQNPYTMLVMMGLMFVMMYFVAIRPQNKARKELAARVAALKKGDQVVLHGGLHATVSQVQERTLIVMLGESGKVKVEKNGVAAVIKSEGDVVEAELVSK